MKSANKIYIIKMIASLLGSILVIVFIGFLIGVREHEVKLKVELQEKLLDYINSHQSNVDNAVINYQRSIFIYQEINKETVAKICSMLLSLEKAAPHKEINLYINTSSGTIEDTFAIIGVMNSIKCKINTIAIGECKPVGTFILCNGTGNIRAAPNAIITIYIPGKEDLNSEDERDRLRSKRIISLWKSNKKIKIPPQWFSENEAGFHYLSPEDAKKYGIINEIVSK